MVRVIYRHTLAPGQTDACFAKAWERAVRAMAARADGVRGASLCRWHADPKKLVASVEWESLAHWRAFWEGGPPDPEGDPARAEILEELARIEIDPAQTKSSALATGAQEPPCEA